MQHVDRTITKNEEVGDRFRKSRQSGRRPVTPEVAGSSPIGPANPHFLTPPKGGVCFVEDRQSCLSIRSGCVPGVTQRVPARTIRTLPITPDKLL